MSNKNTAMKRERHSKEREVEIETLAWLQNVIPSEALSPAVISKKASEIAKRMGKDYNPSSEWARRLLRRNNISLGTESIEVDRK